LISVSGTITQAVDNAASTARFSTDNHSQVFAEPRMSDGLALVSAPSCPAASERSLGLASRGERGVIVRVSGVTGAAEAVVADELERRLLEMGFVEGARIEVLHEGLFGRDPIAVRVDDTRVALRRREAGAVTVKFDGTQP
jgi:ferrous iron transport protein A